MAFIELNIYSQSLGSQQQVYVIIPQQNTSGEIGTVNAKTDKKQYPCLYLLHGLSDNHSIWMRRTSIERYASEYGLCIVMPFGDRSFYTDMKHGGKYYSYIANELPSIISEMFNISTRREDTFIVGSSMGGYGALKIGLRNPQKFSAIGALSAVADIEGSKSLFTDVFKNIWGENIDIPDNDNLFYLAENCNKNAIKPKIYMCVGTEDFLYQSNQKLKQKFMSLDYVFSYSESSGSHCWDFWDKNIQNILEWIFK